MSLIANTEKTKVFEILINKVFKQKYKWFKKFEIEVLNLRFGESYIIPRGKIYVDDDWGYNQWREYNYSTNLPEEDLPFSEIIGGNQANEYKSEIMRCYRGIFNDNRVDSTTFSYINTILVEPKNEVSERFINENNLPISKKFIKIIESTGLFKFLEATKINPYDLIKIVNYKELDRNILTDFLDDVSRNVVSVWISDHTNHVVLFKKENDNRHIVTRFGYGEIETDNYDKFNKFSTYEIIPYSDLDLKLIYELVDIGFLMYKEDIYD